MHHGASSIIRRKHATNVCRTVKMCRYNEFPDRGLHTDETYRPMSQQCKIPSWYKELTLTYQKDIKIAKRLRTCCERIRRPIHDQQAELQRIQQRYGTLIASKIRDRRMRQRFENDVADLLAENRATKRYLYDEILEEFESFKQLTKYGYKIWK